MEDVRVYGAIQWVAWNSGISIRNSEWQIIGL